MNKQKSNEVLALIPARGGSKGLPGKNIRELDGIPLIAHSIIAARNSETITRIVVATDSQEIASIAREFGAETPFMRPAEVSTDTSHAFQIYKYAANWLLENEGYRSVIQCNLLPTTPLRNSEDIDKCINLMLSSSCDWCFTVNEMEHHPYRAMKVLDDTKMRAWFDIPRETLWSNRQELPYAVRFNGGVMAGRTEHILSFDEYNIDNLAFADTDVRYVKMPTNRSFDIDTIEDFEFINFLLSKQKQK
ncbi:MAG: acylneuraminate cytidylyltransferase family protein [Alteromonadaceae bacterium]|nr:acylneuraminate cytidylyltransferase family protein [Alteromonadaceae bacterium]